jgi:hypothetical protein
MQGRGIRVITGDRVSVELSRDLTLGVPVLIDAEWCALAQ